MAVTRRLGCIAWIFVQFAVLFRPSLTDPDAMNASAYPSPVIDIKAAFTPQIICRGSTSRVALDCDKDQIYVMYASYGKTVGGFNTCTNIYDKPDIGTPEDCTDGKSKSEVVKKCQCKKKCEVDAEQMAFGPKCRNQYFMMFYRCIKRSNCDRNVRVPDVPEITTTEPAETTTPVLAGAKGSSFNPTPVIAGVAVTVVIVIILIVAYCFILKRRSKRSAEKMSLNTPQNMYETPKRHEPYANLTPGGDVATVHDYTPLGLPSSSQADHDNEYEECIAQPKKSNVKALEHSSKSKEQQPSNQDTPYYSVARVTPMESQDNQPTNIASYQNVPRATGAAPRSTIMHGPPGLQKLALQNELQSKLNRGSAQDATAPQSDELYSLERPSSVSHPYITLIPDSNTGYEVPRN